MQRPKDYRTNNTQELSCLTEKYINPYNDPRIYWAREVTFDYGTLHQVRVDYMKFKIIGSGGMYPTPLPYCHCSICESARHGNKKDIILL